MNWFINKGKWVLLAFMLAACQGGRDTLPTNAPRIPTETPTLTLTPSITPSPFTPAPVSPIAATWTLTPTLTRTLTRTPQPSATPVPSRTPEPSPTLPPQPTPGAEVISDGVLRLTLSATELNLALADRPNAPQFDFQPDGIWLRLEIENPFLEQTTPARARLETALNPDGFSFRMLTYEAGEGPLITSEQVREAVEGIAPALNTLLIEAFYAALNQETALEFLRYETEWDFLIVEIAAR